VNNLLHFFFITKQFIYCRYPDNIVVTAVEPLNSMDQFELVAVTDILRDDKMELFVKGRRFKEVKAAHSDWPRRKMYPSLKRIGCYEARSGLVEVEESFSFSTVVGKVFPFHMNLDYDSEPTRWNTDSGQWWVLIRLEHTCPPVTFKDV
jgi:hypothetical protein